MQPKPRLIAALQGCLTEGDVYNLLWLGSEGQGILNSIHNTVATFY